MKRKKWYETIDFFKLTGLTLLWVSAWLFMVPHQVDIQSPFFDNVWGAFLKVFGASKAETSSAQQLPDLMSGLAALFIMIILQLRGVFSLTTPCDFSSGSSEKKGNGAVIVFLNIISVLVHTLFFTMLVKIFLFPDNGATASIYESMKLNFGITIFTVAMVTGMLFAVPSLSRIFMVLLFAVGIFKNISVISSIMGLTGFIAALCGVLGFYLEFIAGGFDKNKMLADLAVLSGHYESLYSSASLESKKVRELGKNAVAGIALASGQPLVAAAIKGKNGKSKTLSYNKSPQVGGNLTSVENKADSRLAADSGLLSDSDFGLAVDSDFRFSTNKDSRPGSETISSSATDSDSMPEPTSGSAPASNSDYGPDSTEKKSFLRHAELINKENDL